MPDSERITTMKLSSQSRDRIRSLSTTNETLEGTVIRAIELLERQEFWARAAAATSTGDQQAHDAAIDAWMDRLE
ncbi:MAG: hypothetical protein ACO38I_10240 [Ilumatobacteraceae bacterium]|jgi:hypothetical protein